MRHREIWSEQHYKFGRVDPTPWIPIEEAKEPLLKRLWRGLVTWLYTL